MPFLKIPAFYKWLSINSISSLGCAFFSNCFKLSFAVLFLLCFFIQAIVTFAGYLVLKKNLIDRKLIAQYFNQEFISILPLLITYIILILKVLGVSVPAFSSDSIIGHIYFPWLVGYQQVTSTEYLWLLLIGLGWVSVGLLKLLFWFKRCQCYIGEKKHNFLMFWLALIFILWTQGWAASIYPPTGDEVHYLMMSNSVVNDQDLDLKNDFEHKSWQADYPAEEVEYHGFPDKKGKWYSRHMPALSVLLTPGYIIKKRIGAVFINIILAALSAVMLLVLARELKFGKNVVYLPYFISLIAAPLAFYGYLIYPVVIGSLLCLLGLYSYMNLTKKRFSFAMGSIIGLLPWFHQGLATIALVFLFFSIVELIKTKNFKLFLLFSLGGLITGLPFLITFITTHISTFDHGVYGFGFKWDFIISAILGLWVDRYYGVFIYAPIYLAAFSGMAVWLTQRAKKLPLLIVTLLMANVLMSVLFVDWNGFSGAFPRFVAPVLIATLLGLGFIPLNGSVIKKYLLPMCMGTALLSSFIWLFPFLNYQIPKVKLIGFLGKYIKIPFWEVIPAMGNSATIINSMVALVLISIFSWIIYNLYKASRLEYLKGLNHHD